MPYVWETFTGLWRLMLKVFVIMVALMIALEIFRDFKLLDRLTAGIYPLARRLGFKRDSIYPLLAGVIFGIQYGGGVLIGESSSGRVNARQTFLIALFISICHAVIEDTLLFMAQGANGLIILVVRFTLAIVVVFIASLFIGERENQPTIDRK